MKHLSSTQINEIAQELDCGFRCYIHKHKDEMYFIPDESRIINLEIDARNTDLKKINKDLTNYVVIEGLSSDKSFQIMHDFTKLLSQLNPLRSNLIRALEKRHPFREFKYVIDQSNEYRKKWFAYKMEQLEEYVQIEFKKAITDDMPSD